MCLPPVAMTALSIGFGVVQKVMEFNAQASQASAVAASANASARNQYEQIGLRQAQEKEAAAQKTFETSLDMKRAVSSAYVAGGEANVEGNSFEATVGEYLNRFGRFATATKASTDMTVGQLQAEKDGVRSQAEARIASTPAPSPLSLLGGIGLTIGSGIYDGYRAGDFDGLFAGDTTTTPKYLHYTPGSGY